MKNKKINLDITKDEFELVKKHLVNKGEPEQIGKLARLVSLNKTKHLRKQKVKVYSRDYKYNVGDLIYVKFENKKFRISRNKSIEFSGDLVLRVVNKKYSSILGVTLIELDYEGEGEFKKIINMLKKKKVSLELEAASDSDGKEAPFYKGPDPREQEQPLATKYIKKIKKNLKNELKSSKSFLNWNNYWIHKSLLIVISKQDLKNISKVIDKKKESLKTRDIKEMFFKEKDTPENLLLFSINYKLSNENQFVNVSYENWGKWNLKKFFKNLKSSEPLFESFVKVKKHISGKKVSKKKQRKFIKEYKGEKKRKTIITEISLRELVSGAVKINKSIINKLDKKREVYLIDKEKEKKIKAYVFPYETYILGLKKYYKSNNIVPGTIIQLKIENNEFFISPLRTQKPQKVPLFDYDYKNKKFIEKNITTIHYGLNPFLKLDEGELDRLYEISKDNDYMTNLRNIFIEFSESSEVYKKMHFMRVFHLLDILKRTKAEDVLSILLNNKEFFDSEEEIGYFYLDVEEMKDREEKEKHKKLAKELKEKKRKLEKEISKREKTAEKDVEKKKGEEKYEPKKYDIEKQMEKIAERLDKIEKKSNIVQKIRVVKRKPIKRKEMKEDTEVKEKKVEPEKIEEKKVEEKVEQKVEEKKKPEKKPIKKKYEKKKVVKKEPEFEEKKVEHKEDRRKQKKPKKVYGGKKSEKRIKEEELELKEAEKAAKKALKEGIDLDTKVKKKPVKKGTKVVYSDKKKKKGKGVLGEKLDKLLKDKKED